MNEITIEMRRETVADILKEMAHVDDEGRDWCRRIKAAHDLDIIKAQAEVMCKNGVPMERFNAVVMELSLVREEIARLHAALKPVRECDIEEQYDGNPFDCLDHRAQIPANAITAVREAQRILKAGGKE